MTIAIDNEVVFTQRLFRKLLDSMARPGKLNDIEASPMNLAVGGSLSPFIIGIALTLLDHEVTFHVHDPDEKTKQSISLLQFYTSSLPAEPEHADFIFLRGDQSFDTSRMKDGSFPYPDESATVICQVNRLSNESLSNWEAARLHLRGPGIQDVQTVYIDSLHNDLLTGWKNRNDEFPLGIDWIIADAAGRVCCIPRTTTISWEAI